MLLHKYTTNKHTEVSNNTSLSAVKNYSFPIKTIISCKGEKKMDNVMNQLLECNTDIDRINICLTYMGSIELSLDEIAQVLGFTKERVRKIEFSALKKLKSPPIAKKLREYMMM